MSKFPNLRAELARTGIANYELADKLGMCHSTISHKMLGKRPFTLEEAVRIKQVLGTDIPIEELFSND